MTYEVASSFGLFSIILFINYGGSYKKILEDYIILRKIRILIFNFY